MNIFFVGQTGVLGTTPHEKRVYRLAQELGMRGQHAFVTSATPKQLRRLNGFTMNHSASLIPETPGGLLYTILSLQKAIRANADVIHISDWKAAALGIFAALLLPKATFVWTVDTLPTTRMIGRRLTVWFAARLYDAIITPTRNLQYRFRLTFGIVPVYIPDGYDQPVISDIPASHWKLRKNQYLLTITDNAASLRTLMVSHKNSNSRRKIIALTQAITPALRRLTKRYPLLTLIEATTSRQRASIIRQAKAVILPDTTATQEELLVAMDAGKAVFAVSHPLYQEIAGTTVQFVDMHDQEHLVALLKDAAKQVGGSNKKAKRRAQAHFTWVRIFDEYETFYHYPVVQRVAIDSIGANRIIASVPQG